MENFGKLKKNLGNNVENRHVTKKNSKIRTREKVEKHFGIALTESESKLYTGIAELMWKSKLIKAPTLYYFSKYAMKSLTELIIGTVQIAQERAKTAQRSE